MNCIKWILFFTVAFLSESNCTEFYKYIDKNGNACFTSDYYKVPEAQRKEMKPYIEYQAEPGSREEKDPKEEPLRVEESGKSAKDRDEAELEKTKSRLEGERKDLLQEYETLMKEKQLLDTERDRKPGTRKATLEYNEKADGLSERIKKYENRLKIHNRAVELYNTGVENRSEQLKKDSEKGEKK
jgi:hypothetical protein